MQNKTINGYTLRLLLGEGGMGEVWYAENKLGRKAAVKLLLERYAKFEDVVRRFENEAKVMVSLDHPNIRQVYDYETLEECPCIIMEYLEGADLSYRMKKGERFTQQQLIQWWNEAVSALKYVHAQGIIHRDIKPSNLFITNSGQLKLMDFGIAKVRDSITATKTGQQMGTLSYMSPEQIRNTKNIAYRTDVYSLAVTFYHLVTGKNPYDITLGSDFDIQLAIVNEPLDTSVLPELWRNLLRDYLHKAPAERKELRPFAAQAMPNADTEETKVDTVQVAPPLAPPSAPPPVIPPPPPVTPPRSQSPVKLIAGIIGGVLLLGALAWFIINREEKDTPLAPVEVVSAKPEEEPAETLSPKPENDTKDPVSVAEVKPQQEQKPSQPVPVAEVKPQQEQKPSQPVPVAEVKPQQEQKPSQPAPVAEVKPQQEQKPSQPVPVPSGNTILQGIFNNMVYVEGGVFTMGCTSETGSDCLENEKPARQVRVSSFRISKYPVTQRQWQEVMDDNSSTFENCDNCPVESVSWNDAQEFIRKLNQLTGKNYRLPTEAEWEYAARGGVKSHGYKYAGSNILEEVAWMEDNSGKKTRPVGQKKANELGLYDMSGNVFEWCQDWYAGYGAGAQTNPVGPSAGSSRVLRGGCWFGKAEHCRVFCRYYEQPDGRYDIFGFRLVLPSN